VSGPGPQRHRHRLGKRAGKARWSRGEPSSSSSMAPGRNRHLPRASLPDRRWTHLGRPPTHGRRRVPTPRDPADHRRHAGPASAPAPPGTAPCGGPASGATSREPGPSPDGAPLPASTPGVCPPLPLADTHRSMSGGRWRPW